MIRLGLRLTVQGGREAVTRLAVTALAVAFGVAMVLMTLAGINAVNAQNRRYAWLETAPSGSPHPAGTPVPSLPTHQPALAADAAWWLLRVDEFQGQIIGRLDVAAGGTAAPVPPGIPRLPGPGQFYASPALAHLLRSTPSAELAARYPGHLIGVIGPSALPGPQSLVAIVGRRPATMAALPGAHQVTHVATTTPSSCSGSCAFIGIDANGIDLVLSVAAAALLFPVLIFIGTATRLSATRREQRFAAMRLVGATPRQVSVVSAVESTVAAAVGVAVGFGLFFAVRPALAGISFTGTRFFLGDLSLNRPDIVAVALGVPLAAALAARFALRRVQISPLGVSRRVTPSPPRAWRVVPLLAGLGVLAYHVVAGRPQSGSAQVHAYLPALLVMMAGLVLAGPWLTMVGARFLARRAHRPAPLIAGRRLADNPQAGFRAISGLVLTLFVASVAVGVITSITAHHEVAGRGSAGSRTLVDEPVDGIGVDIGTVAPTLVSRLGSIPGVTGVTVIHDDPSVPNRENAPPEGLVTCTQLARTPIVGRCPAGAAAATVTADGFGAAISTHQSATTWPRAPLSAAQIDRLVAQSLVVATNGSSAAIEQARTDIEQAFPGELRQAPATLAELGQQNPATQLDSQYQRLADVVILVSLAIAGCSLAAAVAAGLSARKRPFSLLRLTGAPLGLLRRVVALESVVPLLIAAVVASGTGFLAAQLFLRSQYHYSVSPPGLSYYVVVVGGLTLSLGVIAATLPLLNRITGPETARNE